MMEPKPWTQDFTVPGRASGLTSVTERDPLKAWRAVILGVIGAVPGVGLSVAPFLLMYAYEQSFIATATPDSAFNVFTLGAGVCLLLAAALVIAALVTLFFKVVRVLGLAYLGGLVCGIGINVVFSLTTPL